MRVAPKIIAAVEIGTSKSVAIVAEVIPGESVSLLGKGEATSRGIRKGEVINFRDACDATHAALHIAEKNSGTSADGVYLAISGRHIEGFHHVGSTAINTPNALVSELDIARATENAKSKALSQDRIYLHHIKNGFALDGKSIETPLHHQGNKLEASYWHVHGDSQKVSESINLINRYGIPVDELIFGGIASAQIAATQEEKNLGCLVLDIGGGTTDYVVYRHGTIVQTGVIPIGGDHITNDIAIGLRVSPTHADTLKRNYAKALILEEDKQQQRWLHGDLIAGNSAIGNRPIKLVTFAQIVQPRLEELFDMVRDSLGEYYDPTLLKGGIILTGGTAALPGIADLARRRMAIESRLWKPLTWVQQESLMGPEYFTALGLLYTSLTVPSSAFQKKPKESFINRITKLFTT